MVQPQCYYEFRLFKPDGALSLILKLYLTDDADAKAMAASFFEDGFATVHIWRNDTVILSVSAPASIPTTRH